MSYFEVVRAYILDDSDTPIGVKHTAGELHVLVKEIPVVSLDDASGVYLTDDTNTKFGVDQTSGQLHVRMFDEAGLGLEVDSTTGALQTVDYPHHEVHSGSFFYVKNWANVANAGTNLDFLWVTPNTTKWAHAQWEFIGADEFTLTLYEDVETSADGSAVTIFNANRNSGTAATVAAYTGPTLAGGTLGDAGQGGTQIWAGKIGAFKTVLSREQNHEIVGKQNVKYWFRINKVNAGTHYIDYDFNWYEHANE